MNVLLKRQGHRCDGSVGNFRNFRKFPCRGVACPPSLVFLYFACSCISLARFSFVEIRDYSQSNKEIACATRQGYLHKELLTEPIVPGFLNYTIYVDINFLLFSFSLLLLLSSMASCVETFEAEVIYFCLFTLL